METFTEKHSSLLLCKEWLVKVDNSNSIPYLLKFGISDESSTCCILITDTKTVWTEVLTMAQLLRRWRECNLSISTASSDEAVSQLQKIISLVHTAGGISEASFEIVHSRDADLAFELDCEHFKWRWDTYLLGPKTSADVISKHLIVPLISVAHIAFYSADPVSELDERDLEKTVDKIGRTARRSLDIHVKHTMARPRIASTVQRVSSLFGFAHTLPSIKSETLAPDFEAQIAALHAQAGPSISPPPASQPMIGSNGSQKINHVEDSPHDRAPVEQKVPSALPATGADSETESDDEDIPVAGSAGGGSRPPSSDPLGPDAGPSAPARGRAPESAVPRPTLNAHDQRSDSDSSPPPKKLKTKPAKVMKDSDSDSDSDSPGMRGRSQAAQGASGSRGAARGVRQPIRRGGRRF